MEKENTCKNCKYFVKHYEIYKSERLRNTNCGHCICEKLNHYLSRKKIDKAIPCVYWEQAVNSTANIENVHKVIQEIKLKLDEIALILKAD